MAAELAPAHIRAAAAVFKKKEYVTTRQFIFGDWRFRPCRRVAWMVKRF